MAEASPQPEKRMRHRSPNYPGFGLRHAVAKAEAIYKADGLAPSSKAAALKHLGYEKMHGEAGRALSALKSFGLIEETGGRVKLTKIGVDIVARKEGDEARQNALRSAAMRPEIYRWIFDSYREYDRLPSDDTIGPELISIKRFNPKALKGFLADFRDTLSFAGLSDEDVVELSEEESEEAKNMTDTATSKAAHPPPPGAKPPFKGDANREISVPVGFTDDGQIVFAHVRFDGPLSKAVLESLKSTLESLGKNLPS
ncbi:MAG: hypothetical protein WD733_25580 [Bryobacterales bacterium]